MSLPNQFQIHFFSFYHSKNNLMHNLHTHTIRTPNHIHIWMYMLICWSSSVSWNLCRFWRLRWRRIWLIKRVWSRNELNTRKRRVRNANSSVSRKQWVSRLHLTFIWSSCFSEFSCVCCRDTPTSSSGRIWSSDFKDFELLESSLRLKPITIMKCVLTISCHMNNWD